MVQWHSNASFYSSFFPEEMLLCFCSEVYCYSYPFRPTCLLGLSRLLINLSLHLVPALNENRLDLLVNADVRVKVRLAQVLELRKHDTALSMVMATTIPVNVSTTVKSP